MPADRVQRPQRRLRLRHGDVDVQPEGRLPPRQLAHRRVHELVAGARRDGDVLPARRRVRAGGRRAQAEVAERLGERRPQRRELGHALADGAARRGGQLERRPVGLGAGAVADLAGQRAEHVLAARSGQPRLRGDEHDLLLDADRPAGRRIAFAPSRPAGQHVFHRHRRSLPSQTPTSLGLRVQDGATDDRPPVEESTQEVAIHAARRRRMPAASTSASNRRAWRSRCTSVSTCHWTPR